jgi:UDP-N-acetyl-D-glucosamine dehydrogenase
MYDQALRKIEEGTAVVSVIGLGYVGLPLAVGLAKRGYSIVGIDASPDKVEAIKQGSSYIPDIASSEVETLVRAGTLSPTTDYDTLHEVDIIFICVPTPFDTMKSPDLKYVRQAATGIASRLRPGQLVVLQSTTYPGTTEEVVKPILENNASLLAGQDFYLAFSPERIDPGRQDFTVENTPKVVGGIDRQSADLAGKLLARLTPEIHVVSSPRAAEMTKLLENIFRSVNIALVNELAILSERMEIDLWEVIEAAKTKPFGFMPFYPSPGVGGHCIPVDAYSLSWKAREYDFYTRFIELAAEVNGDMPYHTVNIVGQGLNRHGKSLNEANVLILGVAFKPNIDDARNSAAERVIELLIKKGAHVSYHDPYVPTYGVGGDVVLRETTSLASVNLTSDVLAEVDCTVIVTGHSSVDYDWIVSHSPLVVDTVNATQFVSSNREKIIRLGAANPIL